MSVIERIAFYRGIRNDIPNQELARELAENQDEQGIREIAGHLWDKNPNVCGDCLKVLYETGYLAPQLIAPFATEFIKLLASKNNRMVWGSMIALSTIAPLKSQELYEARDLIYKAIDHGSVITQDGGIKSLSLVAAADAQYQKELTPYLMNFLRKCRPSDLPRHAEFIDVCINDFNKAEFVSILQERLADASPSQAVRIRKILKKNS
jgi:hypothetical protein